MFRFLIAFGAVCLFSIASAGVAEAGGGGGGAGGGKGGGKAGSIEVTNANPAGGATITVFYRATGEPFPTTVAELQDDFSSIEVAAGDTETISTGEGSFDVLVGETNLIGSLSSPETISVFENDPSVTSVAVMDDSVTEVEVQSGVGQGDAIIGGVTFRMIE